MSQQTENTNRNHEKRDPDLAAAEVAMKRAALKAREKARQVGVGVVILKDGRIIEDRQDASV